MPCWFSCVCEVSYVQRKGSGLSIATVRIAEGQRTSNAEARSFDIHFWGDDLQNNKCFLVYGTADLPDRTDYYTEPYFLASDTIRLSLQDHQLPTQYVRMHAPVEAVSGWEPMKDEADCVSFRGALSQYRPDQRKTNNRVLDFVIDKTKKQFERVYQKIERGSLLFLGFDYTFPQGDPDPEQGFGTVFQHSFNDTARESKTPQKLKSTPPRPRRFKDHPQMEARTPPNSTKRADSSAHLAEHAAAATDADSDIDMSEGDLNDTFPKSPRHHFHQHSHSSKGAAAFRGESIEAMDLTSDNTSHRGDQNPRMPAARKIVAQRARVSKAKPLRHPCPTSELSTEKTVATTKRTRSVSMLIREAEAEAEAEADKMILQANKKSRRY